MTKIIGNITIRIVGAIVGPLNIPVPADDGEITFPVQVIEAGREEPTILTLKAVGEMAQKLCQHLSAEREMAFTCDARYNVKAYTVGSKLAIVHRY